MLASRLSYFVPAIMAFGCVSDLRLRLLEAEFAKEDGGVAKVEAGPRESLEAGISTVADDSGAGQGGARAEAGGEGGKGGGDPQDGSEDGGGHTNATAGRDAAAGGSGGMMNVSPPAPRIDAGGACSQGTWDNDGSSATPCVGHTPCEAGSYVSEPGDAKKDRSCAPCEDGSFSSGGDSAECETWQVCEPGTYLQAEGTRVADRTCSECEEGQFSDSQNAMECRPWRSCGMGLFVKFAGTASSDRQCMACIMGFTSEENARKCSPWGTCAAPDYYQIAEPSPTADRACTRCPSGEASMEDNAGDCSPASLVFQMVAGTAVIEAEHYASTGPPDSAVGWREKVDPNAAGGVVLELAPDDGLHWNVTEAPMAPRVDYMVNFTEVGSFTVYLRGVPGSLNPNRSDTCWIGLDGVPLNDDVSLVSSDPNLHWVSVRMDVVSLGAHRLTIWGRDDGFVVDKIILTKHITPTGVGPDESARN